MVCQSKYFGIAVWISNKDKGVIHGDIKPQNVLVFKDTTGKTVVKVTDFGYSTLVAGETLATSEPLAVGQLPAPGQAGRVFLPKSRPWNAPEHHYGEFTVAEAQKTDVYSFGLLCIWVLFGKLLQNTTEYTFDASNGPLTSLEQLKHDDKMEQIANQWMESVPLNAEQRTRLKEFFSLAVPRNPEKRTFDVEKLVGLLGQEK